MTKISSVYFPDVHRFDRLSDVFVWQRQTFCDDGTWYNGPTERGMIVSPYVKMKLNGLHIPVYAARAAFSTHSFAYAEVEGEGDFSIQVELNLSQKRNRVVVLPESTGVKADIVGDTTVRAVIEKTGSYTFVFDHNVESAVTLLVRRKEAFAVPEGYACRTIMPGQYAADETNFTEENTVYYFKRGIYYLDCVTLPSHSMAYFEEGTVIRVFGATTRSLFRGQSGAHHITVCGRAVIDASALESSAQQTFNFYCVDDITVRDITVVNSCSWTVCFTNCHRVHVHDLVLLSYRIFSDGVMLSDCTDSVVEDCFIRTGDDAAECKSTGNGSTRTDNVVFRNIAAWADKGACYGIVFEENYDTQNVTFENCSVGFSLPNWSDHLGCITVYCGNNPKAVDHHIYFRDIEIYCTYCASAAFVAFEGNIRDIYVDRMTTRYNYHEAPVFLWVRDADKASIGDLYLSDITVGTQKLTAVDQHDLVTVRIPEEAGFVPSDRIHIG
ncbi:MAG: hypothetical protein E7604_00455 [Ruminococcaceae bacterium]|nr:hypothetical protein [Oscillospiraceae bacterium]